MNSTDTDVLARDIGQHILEAEAATDRLADHLCLRQGLAKWPKPR